MSKRRRSFSRAIPSRPYRKRFVVATEGSDTERIYFSMFNSRNSTVQVVLLKSKGKTSPGQVFDRLKRADVGKNDQAWMVIDHDNCEERELNHVFQACNSFGYKMALSNPMFEYWLLLHFEIGNGVNAANVTARLKKYLPDFTKSHVELLKIKPGITDAIKRAEQKDRPPCDKWPITTGTTVYRLVKELLNAAKG